VGAEAGTCHPSCATREADARIDPQPRHVGKVEPEQSVPIRHGPVLDGPILPALGATMPITRGGIRGVGRAQLFQTDSHVESEGVQVDLLLGIKRRYHIPRHLS